QVNVDIVAILLARYSDDLAPAAAFELRHDRVNFGRRVLVLFFKRETLYVDALDVFDQVANLSIVIVFARKEFRGRLHDTFVQLYVHSFTRAVGQQVQLVELQLGRLGRGHHVRDYHEQERGREFQNISEEYFHN